MCVHSFKQPLTSLLSISSVCANRAVKMRSPCVPRVSRQHMDRLKQKKWPKYWKMCPSDSKKNPVILTITEKKHMSAIGVNGLKVQIVTRVLVFHLFSRLHRWRQRPVKNRVEPGSLRLAPSAHGSRLRPRLHPTPLWSRPRPAPAALRDWFTGASGTPSKALIGQHVPPPSWRFRRGWAAIICSSGAALTAWWKRWVTTLHIQCVTLNVLYWHDAFCCRWWYLGD